MSDAPSPRRVRSVNVARAAPLFFAGGRSVASGIRKRPVEGAVALRALNLDGDEQADLSVHGGLSKAVYAYPFEHYPFWQTVRAQAGAAGWDTPLAHGALGENLTLEGVLEADVYVGDVLRFAGCALAVMVWRLASSKSDSIFSDGVGSAAKVMVTWAGWPWVSTGCCSLVDQVRPLSCIVACNT